MSSDEIKGVEASIQRAKVAVELGNALERLNSNRDFRAIVKEGYFKDEAVRLVHLRVDPAMQTPERQESIMKQIDAVAGLSQYFLTIEQQAAMAGRSIASDEETLQEMLAEGAL